MMVEFQFPVMEGNQSIISRIRKIGIFSTIGKRAASEYITEDV